MPPEKVSIPEKLELIQEHWSPRIVAETEGFQFRLAKLLGEFVWHSHADTDETFIVIEGEMCIEFRDGRVDLRKGDMLVVPRGVEHRPVAEQECNVMIFEREGTVNTGDAATGDLTADPDARI